MSEVVNLGARRAYEKDDNALIEPVEMLRDVLSEVDGGHVSASSMMVLYLDRGEDGRCYDIGWWASKLSMSEMVALLDTMKAMIHRDMGY